MKVYKANNIHNYIIDIECKAYIKLLFYFIVKCSYYKFLPVLMYKLWRCSSHSLKWIKNILIFFKYYMNACQIWTCLSLEIKSTMVFSGLCGQISKKGSHGSGSGIWMPHGWRVYCLEEDGTTQMHVLILLNIWYFC